MLFVQWGHSLAVPVLLQLLISWPCLSLPFPPVYLRVPSSSWILENPSNCGPASHEVYSSHPPHKHCVLSEAWPGTGEGRCSRAQHCRAPLHRDCAHRQACLELPGSARDLSEVSAGSAASQEHLHGSQLWSGCTREAVAWGGECVRVGDSRALCLSPFSQAAWHDLSYASGSWRCSPKCAWLKSQGRRKT